MPASSSTWQARAVCASWRPAGPGVPATVRASGRTPCRCGPWARCLSAAGRQAAHPNLCV